MDFSGSEISPNWSSRVSGLWSKMGPKFGIESMRARLDVKNNHLDCTKFLSRDYGMGTVLSHCRNILLGL